MAHPRSAVDLTGELVAHPPEDLDKFFQAVLTQCPQLQSLDLAANGLGDSGVASLMGAMRHPDVCKHLAFLGLARNDICDSGGRRIATWLALSSRPLERLDLRDNSLGDAAASAFAAVLAANRSLHHLSLLHNSIGHAGAQSLALALRHNQTLVTLDLRLNLIAPGELHAMLGRQCANGDASAAALLPNEHGETVSCAPHVVDPRDCETRAAPTVHPHEGRQQAAPAVDPLERGRQVALSPCQRGEEGGSAPIESDAACRRGTEVEVTAAGQRLQVRGRPSLDMLLATDSESDHQDDTPRAQSVSDAPSSMEPLRTCHATDGEVASLSGQVKPSPLSNTAAIAMRLGLSVPPGFVQQWQQQMSVRAERSYLDDVLCAAATLKLALCVDP
ncbi:hypothetical protein AB1Y20_018613 [Prymnesium parvum]|uniref:Uncharacterized protein n=1 Tax=Prymnesium parvum TaxID=97485 RepID=A0AB34JP84_PRYPA